MTDDEIRERVFKTISNVIGKDVGPGEVSADAKIVESFGVSSLELVEIVFELEDVFDVQFSDEETSAMETINDLIENIKQKKGSE